MSCAPHPQPDRLVGDPIDVVTGANVERNLDFRLIGPFHLEWHRHYDSSRCGERHALGRGHTHHFDRSIVFDLDGVRYHGPLRNGVGFRLPERGGGDVIAGGMLLRRWQDGRFWLYEHAAPIMQFDVLADPAVARLTRLIDGRHRIRFGYDAADRLETITDAAGRSLLVRSDDAGRVVRILHAASRSEPERILHSYAYDEAGCLITATDSAGRSRHFEYDAAHRLIARTDRSGYTFHFEYDDAGRCVRSVGSDGLQEIRLEYLQHEKTTRVIRGDSGRWSYHANDDGMLVAIVDPYGGIRRFEIDDRGRVATETDALGNPTTCVYGPTGALVAKRDVFGRTRPEPASSGDDAHEDMRVPACPAEWEFGRLVGHARASLPGAGDASLLRVPASVRMLVRLRRTDDPRDAVLPYDVAPFAREWRPPPVRGREFDETGRLVRQRGADGAARSWEYDAIGNVRRYTDFDGAVYTRDHASWNLLVRETDPLGASVAWDYTVHEKVSSVADPAGNESEYAWDLADRLTAVRRNGAVRERYSRDAAGNLVAKTDGIGNDILRMKVGPGNRVVEKRLASGAVHTFAFDEAGRTAAIASDGQATSFEYDRWGNRTAEAGPHGSVVHVFDGWRKLLRTTILGRFVIGFGRDDSRLTITDPAGITHRIDNAGDGLVIRTMPGGDREVTQFDWNGRTLLKAVDRRGGRPAHSSVYTYSGEGDLTAERDSATGIHRFEYDAAHRLVRAASPHSNDVFEYDRAANLLAQPGLAGVRLAAGNRIATANGDRFEYDTRNHIAERITASGVVQCRYDSRDMLIGIDGPGLEWSATYDPHGRRTQKTVNGATTNYIWDSERVAAEVFPDGSVRIWIHADPLALAPIAFVDYATADAEPAAGRTFCILHNQVSTPVRVQDVTGDVAWEASIAPYGKADIRKSSIDMPVRFPGHRFDPETGLHYNRFRYYSPELGRYLQSDPFGVAGGVNLYAYPASPLSCVDVRGLNCPECDEKAKQAAEAGDDEEPTQRTPAAVDPAELDQKFGPATNPWMIRDGEGVYPPDAHIVRPGEPVPLNGYTAPNGEPGRYVYIIDQHGNMHLAPANGALGRETKHTDLAQNGPARVSGEIVPTNDPNVWIMNDDSGRYSYQPVPPPPARPLAFQPTRTGDNLKNANETLNQGNLGNNNVYNEADLQGDQYGR